MPTDSRDKGRIFDEIKSRGKEERKAAELEGFAAENIKEGLYSTNHLCGPMITRCQKSGRVRLIINDLRVSF